MRAFAVALALVWTVLLGAIALQLHELNTHLAWLGAPVRGLAARVAELTPASAPETREQRVERKAREMNDASDENADVIRRAFELDRAKRASKGAKQPQ